ncbi:hypothetical protein P9990_26385 (plasmid) [Prescottella equi]|uniref:hypothetical protein n=1 Tax=Rhodococcus hoagii TaxID=43767 RepID=UPI002577B0AB|nr:hypothetical protein [Prescottella equi]WJJ14344.1 hypothetical protein P9990_26385 [Prescottella equi]
MVSTLWEGAKSRKSGLHQLSTRLVHTHTTGVVEDLHVPGMARNPRLARRIAGVGMAELRRQLAYKVGWHGAGIQVTDG